MAYVGRETAACARFAALIDEPSFDPAKLAGDRVLRLFAEHLAEAEAV